MSGGKIIKWRGNKVYRCRHCAFDTLDKQRFEQHIVSAHPPLRVIQGGKQAVVEPEKPAEENNNGDSSS